LADRNRVVLVGSEGLLGREFRDISVTTGAELDLRLITADEDEAGTLTRVGDEPAMVGGLTEESLSGARAIVLAGSAESSRKALELVDEDGTVFVDLTYAAEERPDSRLRAPLVEEEPEADGAGVHVIAHPAAIAAAMLLRRLHANDPVERSIVHIFAPASELGTPGVEELQQQTIGLLSFKGVPKNVFDAQLSFNMLARYGEEAPVKLEEAELRIERHLASLLDLPGDGAGVPMPSIRLIQAPVFHGYSFSVWVEFETSPGVDAIQNSLATGNIDVRGEDTEPPTNVGQAGQSGITVGAIEPDRNVAEACWFWMVADNLRLAAENAIAVVRELL
jgi:aspartate-semialdehyde dehydrogenase